MIYEYFIKLYTIICHPILFASLYLLRGRVLNTPFFYKPTFSIIFTSSSSFFFFWKDGDFCLSKDLVHVFV
jgi:hypothetical protein